MEKHLTEREKAARGLLYDANYDASLLAERRHCKAICMAFNQLEPTDLKSQEQILQKLFGKMGEEVSIETPFFCDYGYNIEIGSHVFINMDCIFLDEAKVTLGDYVFIGPKCGFYTAQHPLDSLSRNKGLEYALPITIGNNVWIGAQCCILPGVTIGDNTVIGAGSVVTRSIPANVVAYGNPCRVIRPITSEDAAYKVL